MDVIKLLDETPPRGDGEEHTTLLATRSLRVVRIVSRGHASPPGRWYDQDEHEWVAVLSGEARIEVEGRAPATLRAGDAILLPARTRHRVARTQAGAPTVWLAVFFSGELPGPLPAEIAARVVGHMNDDHRDALLDYARALRAVRDAMSAKMTSVDAAGFDLEAESPSGPRQLRFEFDAPIGDSRGAREALVALAAEARRRR